ncbi:hypothetical protein C8D72_2564 [Kushneria indalinina DSM 14324]|uniref:Uncharacterized protein n=1 Tax=Kushneria indalinina DSM 14324 TaxID=1122140 RepID=A0A3D9DV07_9GAMM|nr:hypothetical protein C8D72_2564 [Kushneria indalinina DSM 14324]
MVCATGSGTRLSRALTLSFMDTPEAARFMMGSLFYAPTTLLVSRLAQGGQGQQIPSLPC